MSKEKYVIKLDRRTVVTVLAHQIYNTKWIKHFGSIEKVAEFIKNYDKEEE